MKTGGSTLMGSAKLPRSSRFAATLFSATAILYGQFGGRPGDVVFYAVTYNGSGEFQTLPPGTTNGAATLATIKVTHMADVPYERSDPFPLFRQVMYMTPQETFQ